MSVLLVHHLHGLLACACYRAAAAADARMSLASITQVYRYRCSAIISHSARRYKIQDYLEWKEGFFEGTGHGFFSSFARIYVVNR